MDTRQFEGLSQTIRDNIPHVKLGSSQPVRYAPDPLVEKMKKWFLIGLSALVGGTAVILLIWRIIARFV